MHSEFYTYFLLGLQHIGDVRAYDHILFVVALCAIYRPEEWKKILFLVTAFTVGHSLTLALAALDVLKFRSDIIEFLIPITIFITAVLNFRKKSATQNIAARYYLLPLFFGFIHGMGFSNYFKSLLSKEESVVNPLFAFNVGIEAGQLIIVVSFMVLSWILLKLFSFNQEWWTKIISGIIAMVSLYLMWETKFW